MPKVCCARHVHPSIRLVQFNPTISVLYPVLEPVAVAGTHATRCRDARHYARLSSFSRHHPCAKAAAASAVAASPAAATSMSFVSDSCEYAGGARGEERESSAAPGPEVVLLLPRLSAGGGGANTARNHAGFAVQSDGTAGKLYGDLGGSVEGVTFTHVSLSRTGIRSAEWG